MGRCNRRWYRGPTAYWYCRTPTKITKYSVSGLMVRCNRRWYRGPTGCWYCRTPTKITKYSVSGLMSRCNRRWYKGPTGCWYCRTPIKTRIKVYTSVSVVRDSLSCMLLFKSAICGIRDRETRTTSVSTLMISLL